jgi:hypothetical protein
MKVRFHAAALDEVERTAKWYEDGQAGLGDEFLAVLDDVLSHLERDDIVTSPVREDVRVRRVFLPRFPHSVVIIDAHGERVVLAVAHLKRKPGYWLARLGD